MTDNEEALVEFCLEEFDIPVNDRCQGALALSCDNTIFMEVLLGFIRFFVD
ncbi:MAG: hypothetical protein R2730_03480 [Chitinophagales bacterium]